MTAFMDRTGPNHEVEARHSLEGTFSDIMGLAAAAGLLLIERPPLHGAAKEIASRIESLAAGLVVELKALAGEKPEETP